MIAESAASKTEPYVHPHALFFEDFHPELVLRSPARTVTETDVQMFAMVTGDYNPLHTDEEFSKTTQFGTRIAHGLLGLSTAVGLISRLGVIDGTVIGFVNLEWQFVKPVVAGDTIRATATVGETKPARTKTDRGTVKLILSMENQRGEEVQRGSWTFLMKRRA